MSSVTVPRHTLVYAFVYLRKATRKRSRKTPARALLAQCQALQNALLCCMYTNKEPGTVHFKPYLKCRKREAAAVRNVATSDLPLKTLRRISPQ